MRDAQQGLRFQERRLPFARANFYLLFLQNELLVPMGALEATIHTAGAKAGWAQAAAAKTH